MQLQPGERSILAYFPSTNSAQRAMEELKSAGYETVQLDRVSRYGVNNNAEINNPLAGRAETNTGLTLFSAGTDSAMDVNERILKVSDPSVSGYGCEDYGVAGGKAFLLTVVTSENKVQQAVEIMEKHGAQV